MYILTQEEYDALVNKADNAPQISTKQLQKLCTRIANEMPVRWTWGDGKAAPKPWGCKLDREDWVCDECPVQTICPSDEMEYSK